MFRGTSRVSVCAQGLLSCQWAPWRDPGTVLFAPSLQVFIDIAKVPPSLLFSRLNSCGSLSISHGRDTPIPSSSLWPFIGLSSSLLYWGAQSGSSTPGRWEGSPPLTYWQHFECSPEPLFAFSTMKTHCCLVVNLVLSPKCSARTFGS